MSATGQNTPDDTLLNGPRIDAKYAEIDGCPWDCDHGILVTDGHDYFCNECHLVRGGVDETPARRQLRRFEYIYSYQEPDRYENSGRYIMPGASIGSQGRQDDPGPVEGSALTAKWGFDAGHAHQDKNTLSTDEHEEFYKNGTDDTPDEFLAESFPWDDRTKARTYIGGREDRDENWGKYPRGRQKNHAEFLQELSKINKDGKHGTGESVMKRKANTSKDLDILAEYLDLNHSRVEFARYILQAIDDIQDLHSSASKEDALLAVVWLAANLGNGEEQRQISREDRFKNLFERWPKAKKKRVKVLRQELKTLPAYERYEEKAMEYLRAEVYDPYEY